MSCLSKLVGGIQNIWKQFLKFGVVGTIAFIIDYGIMTLLLHLGMDAVPATSISYLISLLFNYFASMRYVFTHRDDISRRKEFIIFVILSIIGFFINEAIIYIGELLHITAYIMKIVATAVVMLWNFFSRKKWLDAN